MAITVTNTEMYVMNPTRRMPFHFGNMTATKGSRVVLEVELNIDGDTQSGLASGGTSPMWFFKDPDLGVKEGTDMVFDLLESTSTLAEDLPGQESLFAVWKNLRQEVKNWAGDTSYPPLFWSYGVSVVEQAIIDAFCQYHEVSFPQAVHENVFEIELGAIHPELTEYEPIELLPDTPLRSTAVRHTVGLGDPLVPADVDPEDQLDDGLPQALSEYIQSDGIDHFKIKLAAEPSDFDRLRNIQTVIEESLDEYAFTLDANEQYDSVSTFREQWENLRESPELCDFFENLLYVEQPLPRDQAFSTDTQRVFDEWDDHPPIIIDESDDRLDSLRKALETGYAGTSHKNCKGVFKGIANRCLVEYHRQNTDGGEYVMSGEDLTTLGPIELQEDLAVMATIGCSHVERNGHHYYQGLRALSDDSQTAVLEAHPDLYRLHEQSYPTLSIEEGRISLDTTVEAPFGYDVAIDTDQFVPVDEWSMDAILE